ncbi:MAG: DUF3857 domain-containing protein [Planctomycetes bacterium]|nr:DUF3857 domain-containing protein [Planctomycetota bacterium]
MQRILPIILIAGLYAACASTPSPENIPAENTAALENTAESLLNNLDYLAATNTYIELIESDLKLLRDEGDLSDKSMLRAHTEFMGLKLYQITKIIGNQTAVYSALSELEISAADGGIYEMYCNLSPRSVDELGHLHKFEFIGPFDNERGIAFDSQLAAEKKHGNTQSYQGKVRDVSWRTTPDGVHPHGQLNFGQLLHPNRQSAILMRSWVYSPAAQIAYATIGVDGEIAAWCNGEAILEARGRHAIALHNFSAPLNLKSGWNELAFKLGSRDHSPKLKVRLVDDSPEHRPLLLKHRATAPEGKYPAKLAATTSAGKLRPQQLGALMYYRLEDDNYRAGILEMLYNIEPRSSHPGRDALAQAVKDEPENLFYRLAYANSLFPEPHQAAEEIDLNPWLHQSQIISRQAPDNIRNLRLQLISSIQYQRLKKDSIDLAKRIVELSDSAPPALIDLADTYQSFNYGPQSLRAARQALKHPLITAYPNQYYRALLSFDKNSREFTDGINSHFASFGSHGSHLASIKISHRHREQFEISSELAELESLLELDPWNTVLMCEYAMRILNAGYADAANKLLDRAAAIKPENSNIWHHRARSALHADDYPTAVVNLKKELEIDYNNDSEQRLLKLIDTTAAQESFEAPHREDYLDIIERHPFDEIWPGYSLETLLRRAVIKVSPEGKAQRYYRDVIRILSNEGARQMAVMKVSKYLHDLRILAATVHSSDGGSTDIPVGRGRRAYIIEFPNLKIGDVIDIEYLSNDDRSEYLGNYFSLNHQLSPKPSMPTRESRLTLITDSQLPLQLHTTNSNDSIIQQSTKSDEGNIYDWTAREILPLKPESFMPHASELITTVQATSYSDWEQFGEWWWNLVEDSITVTKEMSDKVIELTAGLSTKQQKLEAIYQFVTNEIRYNAWGFGVHALQPYSAPVIFSRRFGDCKDKAILLRAMLAEVDIDALLVLIKRSGTSELRARRPQEDLSLAMIGHFNHCVAYLPEQDGIKEQYLDGTATLTAIENFPFDDRGSEVLVVGPEGSTRKFIPFKEATFNLVKSNLDVQLNSDGSAHIVYDNIPSGSFDNQNRVRFSNGIEQNQERMKNIASSMFGSFEGDLEIRLPQQNDLKKTPSFGFSGNFTKWATVNSGAIELDASPFKDRMLIQFADLATRETDVVLRHAYTKKRKYHVAVPLNYQVKSLKPVALSNSTGSYSWTMAIDGNNLTIDEQITLSSPRIAAEDYNQFRRLCRTIDDTQNLIIRISEAN